MARNKGNRALATAALLRFQGDTGVGRPGVLGLVPPPASGDAAKFLKADGTWTALSTSNLSDRETGTWTPALNTTGTPPTTLTYTEQTGLYTKIGNVVHVSIRIVINAFTLGPGTGIVGISGLPFTPNSSQGSSAFAMYTHGVNWNTGSSLAGQIIGADTTLYPTTWGDNIGGSNISMSDLASTGQIVTSGSYFV